MINMWRYFGRCDRGCGFGWSSFRDYGLEERGPVLVNELLPAKMKVRNVTRDDSLGSVGDQNPKVAAAGIPGLRKPRRPGRPQLDDVDKKVGQPVQQFLCFRRFAGGGARATLTPLNERGLCPICLESG